jgi:hypothetical protein
MTHVNLFCAPNQDEYKNQRRVRVVPVVPRCLSADTQVIDVLAPWTSAQVTDEAAASGGPGKCQTYSRSRFGVETDK